MGDQAPAGPANAARSMGSRPVTAWVVSPHLLVAQAVTAALRSAGAPVEVRAWETVTRDARAGNGRDGTRHVVAILDGLDGLQAVEEITRLVSVGDVRVAVVTSNPSAVWWGGLVEGGAVDVVTVATSVGELADVVQRFAAGGHLMEPERRRALRAAWVQALDRRRHLIALMRTLSPQQQRVLELLASGRQVGEVADHLGVTRGTIRSHVKSLRGKLGAKTQLEAVAMLREVYAMGESAAVVPRPRRGEPADAEGTPARR